MYIVAIAWIYVIAVMAATESNLVAGISTFLFYGLLPLAVFLFVFGLPRRRGQPAAAEQKASGDTVDQETNHDDGRDAERNQ